MIIFGLTVINLNIALFISLNREHEWSTMIVYMLLWIFIWVVGIQANEGEFSTRSVNPLNNDDFFFPFMH